MKNNPLAIALGVGLVVAAMGAQANQGQGEIKFQGSIIDAPCSISAESANQTVEMGQIANVMLDGGKKSVPKKFSIALENCAITTKQNVLVTFNGQADADKPNHLVLVGSAKGATLAIGDDKGDLIKLGEASEKIKLTSGNNTLNFTAWLEGKDAAGTVTPGDFQSVANFTLNYQ